MFGLDESFTGQTPCCSPVATDFPSSTRDWIIAAHSGMRKNMHVLWATVAIRAEQRTNAAVQISRRQNNELFSTTVCSEPTEPRLRLLRSFLSALSCLCEYCRVASVRLCARRVGSHSDLLFLRCLYMLGLFVLRADDSAVSDSRLVISSSLNLMLSSRRSSCARTSSHPFSCIVFSFRCYGNLSNWTPPWRRMIIFSFCFFFFFLDDDSCEAAPLQSGMKNRQ